MRSIEVILNSPLSLDEVRARTVTGLVATLNRDGYSVISQSETVVALGRTSRSTLVWFFTIITFPIGLIWFFSYKRAETVSIVLRQAGSGTRVEITGYVEKRVAKHFDSIESG